MDWLNTIDELNNQQIKDKATRDEILRNIESCNTKLEDITNKDAHYTNTIDCLLSISEYSRASVQEHFEKFVTYILQYVFGDDYSFKVIWNTGAKNTTVDFVVVTPTDEGILAVDPKSGKGGGVCDVVSFGLRLAFLTKLNNRSPILLDESFSQLSKTYIPNVASLFKDINEKFGYQIIFITHQVGTDFTENCDQLITL